MPAREPQQSRERDEHPGHADDPPRARLRFPPQDFLDEALAARHLVEGLLVRRDAPYLVVRQRRSLVARRFLQRIEPIHFALEAHRIAGGAFIRVVFASAQKPRRTDPRCAFDQCQNRLIAGGGDHQPGAR